jgi:hypothetical protein
MSSSSPQLDPNKDVASPSHPGALSHTSIALICAFVICFSFFVYLSSRAPRISDPVRAAASRPRRSSPRRPKPKLWDVWLDRIGGAVCNWHVSRSWNRTVELPCSYAITRSWRPRSRTIPRRRPAPRRVVQRRPNACRFAAGSPAPGYADDPPRRYSTSVVPRRVRVSSRAPTCGPIPRTYSARTASPLRSSYAQCGYPRRDALTAKIRATRPRIPPARCDRIGAVL